VAILAITALAYGVVEQIYDTNFYVLWETTAILAGDHPYRDFFQMGWPLLTAVSTAVQWLVGYRLIGEFAIHWLFMAASLVIGFHLAWRLSHSLAASVVTTVIGVWLLLSIATFQFPKLFFYPVAVLSGWWSLEEPGVRRAAALGAITALAFLYRHDHGIYIGFTAVLAFAMGLMNSPQRRQWQAALREIAAYMGVTVVILAPWIVLVQSSEGIADYIRTRAEWGSTWAPASSPYLTLLRIDPRHLLSGEPGRPLSREGAGEWFLQLTLALPILAAITSVASWLRSSRGRRRLPHETLQVLLGAALVSLVASRLFRENGYFVVVLPLTIAFGARLLVAGLANGAARGSWRVVRGAVTMTVLTITIVAAVGYVDWDLFASGEREELASAYRRLLVSPPIDGYEPTADARAIDPESWPALDDNKRLALIIRYIHDCTTNRDRLFVTGSTPYQVGYYAERAIAGGHVQWHHGWRSDPVHEQQSLALLERQSVLFAVSTHDRVLDDLKAYPHIHDYFLQHYAELQGTHGTVLVDRRRHRTGIFGQLGFPCFA
jgi:hypothetical protein